MSDGDLYAEVEQLVRDLSAQGHTRWSEELHDVLRGGATGSEIVMGIRWVLTRMSDSGEVGEPETAARARELAAQATRALSQ